MMINGIREIKDQGNSVDVVLSVTFDEDTTNRWELVDPLVQVVLTVQGEVQFDYMELIDQGMIVHAFEFKDEEIRQISDYLKENHIKDKVQSRCR